jgi:hypothetical protein
MAEKPKEFYAWTTPANDAIVSDEKPEDFDNLKDKKSFFAPNDNAANMIYLTQLRIDGWRK